MSRVDKNAGVTEVIAEPARSGGITDRTGGDTGAGSLRRPGPIFRGDIEGLRALAVLMVVLFHARLGPFDGGFIGVDVFFVVSGYLITSLLWREIEANGRVALGAFWARRARRLLPASILVIVATLLASRLILDPLTQRDVTVDAFAATFFSANFVFAFQRSGYFASQLDPSPLLHYWSLAVEEQFYVVWPFLIAAVGRVAHARRLFTARVVIGVVIAGSFLLSAIYSSRTDWAFYMLATRAWELGAGALLALGVPWLRRIPKVVRAVAGWLALVVLGVATVTYDATIAFPGTAAVVPVVATMVLVAVGDTRRRVGPSQLLAAPPLQWIGARSYAIYLWHWPLLVFAAAQYGELSASTRAALAVASVGLGALSYQLIENPIRHDRRLTGSTRSSLVFGGALLAASGMLVNVSVGLAEPLSGSGVAAAPTLQDITEAPVAPPVTAPTATTTTIPSNDTVTGSRLAPVQALRTANYAALSEGLLVEQVPGNLDPALGNARANEPDIYTNGCHLVVAELEPRDCQYGDKNSSTDVLLFGDSHAAQWFPAIERVAAANGWRLHVMTKSGCPTASIPQGSDARDKRCQTWRDNVLDWVDWQNPELVVMSARAYDYLRHDVWVNEMTDLMDAMRPDVGQILMLGDTPDQKGDVPACLAENLSSVRQCLTPRDVSINPYVMDAEVTLATRYEAMFEPTTDWVCSLDGCPVIVGNVLMYRDDNHLTTNAVLLLEPYLREVLTAAMASAG
jgi:peptidoglycan/LPS O-acetylase OafA/YrhL